MSDRMLMVKYDGTNHRFEQYARTGYKYDCLSSPPIAAPSDGQMAAK